MGTDNKNTDPKHQTIQQQGEKPTHRQPYDPSAETGGQSAEKVSPEKPQQR